MASSWRAELVGVAVLVAVREVLRALAARVANVSSRLSFRTVAVGWVAVVLAVAVDVRVLVLEGRRPEDEFLSDCESLLFCPSELEPSLDPTFEPLTCLRRTVSLRLSRRTVVLARGAVVFTVDEGLNLPVLLVETRGAACFGAFRPLSSSEDCESLLLDCPFELEPSL